MTRSISEARQAVPKSPSIIHQTSVHVTPKTPRKASVTQLEVLPRAEWQADQDAITCKGCSQDFNVFRRRHHCRYCGKVFCFKCSKHLINKVRSCNTCNSNYKDIEHKLEIDKLKKSHVQLHAHHLFLL